MIRSDNKIKIVAVPTEQTFANGRNEVAFELDGEDQGDAIMVSISLPNQVNVKEQ